MTQVTVTGGQGNPAAVITYDSQGLALMKAEALAAVIDAAYTTAVYYNHFEVGQSGYAIIDPARVGSASDVRGFSAVVVENDGTPTSVIGGGTPGGQIVLAGDGGMYFTATSGDVTVVAGGGNNRINLAGDSGDDAVYIAAGDNTVIGGSGNTTIAAGIGDNTIRLGAGVSEVYDTGHDRVFLGSGSETINVGAGGSVDVFGAASVAGSGVTLTFINGDERSTVHGGAGTYHIEAGAGGGVFKGGSAGDNYLVAGSGKATLFGGGAGDTLIGGSAADRLVAALGNETLMGGTGATTFNLTVHDLPDSAGSGTMDSIYDFNAHDILYVGNAAAVNYALETYHVVGSNGVFLLEDGTKVTLEGFTGTLNHNDLK